MCGDLIKVKIEELRPTQAAVGYEEVQAKRQNWRARTIEQKAEFIATHPFPAVRGPDGLYFVIDGHHLGLALLEEGVDVVWVRPVEDFSRLEGSEFWRTMDQQGFLCPSDAKGRDLQKMPQTVRDLVDDPFRSLVARLRRTCGCPKDRSPFAEFRWADYLRHRMRLDALQSSPEATLKRAKELVREGICKGMQGHCQCGEI
jgi:hypothetical protein